MQASAAAAAAPAGTTGGADSDVWVQRGLFGGAITCTIPARFDDVSTVRDVPDNQEVFSDPSFDQSIIVELVEETNTTVDEMASFHWNEIADVGGAVTRNLQLTGVLTDQDAPRLPPGTPKAFAIGTQNVAKFRETAVNTVLVAVAVVRLPAVRTELLVSVNSPVALHPHSTSAGAALAHPDAARALLQRVVHSLGVEDWSLFR